jgi:UDPglucose 6-dehydrogenase
LAAGTAIKNLLHPDRVIIGSASTPSGQRAAAALADVYAAWVPRSKIVTTNLWSSELSKLVANSMLAQRISSINSISAICEKIGADIDDVSKSVGLDNRIGNRYLKAGIGFGGSCFKKDILSLVYLAQSLGLEEVGEYWTQVLEINEWQRIRFSKKIIDCLNGTLSMKKVTILGYAFKEDTSDTRESPALECIKSLLEDVPSEIAVFDPFCDPAFIRSEIRRFLGDHVLKEAGGPIEVYADAYQACANSHAIIITTDCEKFRNTTSPVSKPRRQVQEDPRPFQHLSPTESEILRLQDHLSSTLGTANPLSRFTDEPECESGCAACEKEAQKAPVNEARSAERLDWNRIAYHLQKPKWVFDGRGVLQVPDMEALGIRVEGIGRVGWSGR